MVFAEFIIKTIGLTKYYHDILAIEQMNLDVLKGEIFGLLGPNGSGKTTTIRILTGLIRPSSGEAIVAGYDIIKNALRAKKQMGIVPDISNIYEELSAMDNLLFAGQLYNVPRKDRIKRAEEFLKKFGLYERKDEKVGNFSRGMKRRLTIAAALMHEPKILFLDEPTTGLDVQSTKLIRTLLKELNENDVSIFLTTHYIEEADFLCDRVAIIKNGRIIKVDTPEQLKQNISTDHIIEVVFNKSNYVIDKLEQLNYVDKVIKIEDKFRIWVGSTSESVPLIIDFARENNLKVISINTLKPSLEDAFIELTGLSSEIMIKEKELVKKK